MRRDPIVAITNHNGHSLKATGNKSYKSKMKDLPHHVPIRKENRWDPIQHYATAPNTAVAAIPIRRPIVSELLMPKRQESVSSSISQSSSITKLRHSNRSLTSMSREYFDDDSSTTGSTTTPFSPRQQQCRRRYATSSILSSPSSQNIRYSSKQSSASRSLFSNSPLTTTFEEQKNSAEDSYRFHYANLNNADKPSKTRLQPSKKYDQDSSGGDDWFQHSDDSSLSQDEEPHFAKPSSDRSTKPIIDEYENRNSIPDRKHAFSANQTAFGTENGVPSSHMTPTRAIVTEESVKRVLRESAPHSLSVPGYETSASDTASTKLDRLREKMKRLRKKNHQQILQSRFQLERTRSSTQNGVVKKKESTETAGGTALSRNHSFLFSPTHSKKQMPNKTPSLKRIDSSSPSTDGCNVVFAKSNKFQEPSLYRARSLSQSSGKSSMDRMPSFSKSTSMRMIPKENSMKSTDISHLSDSDSDSWSLDSGLSNNKSESIEEAHKEDLKSNLRENFNSTPRKTSRAFVPHASLSSRCMSIAEEGEEEVEDENEEVGEEKRATAEPTIDYDPAFDPDLDINSSFDSSKRDSSQDQAQDEELDEDLYINSSFESSKCSSIAEEVVQSLRAERRTMNPLFPKGEVQTERQYDSSIHITRRYSIGRSAKKPASPSSSPCRSPLQQKLERRGRRPTATTNAKQETHTSGCDNEISPEAKILAQELREAISARGTAVPAEEETTHPWCDPIQSDGILPLASEDSLSSPAETTPRSFQDKRKAYLERIGDPEESRHQSPFTTANWVFGRLPEKPPIHSSPSQSKEVREQPEFSAIKTKNGSPRKRNSRMNVRKNAYDLSPSQDKSSLMSPKTSKNADSKYSDGQASSQGTRRSASSKQSWVKNTTATSPKPSEICNKKQPSSTKRRSKSLREKVNWDTNMASSRNLATNERDERDEKLRTKSSRKLPSASTTTNELLSGNEFVESTKEESIRRMVRSKSCKEKEDETIASMRRNPRRRSSQSSLDQPGERKASELSKQLLRIDSSSSMNEEREEKRKRQTNSNSSAERGRDVACSSKKLVRNNRKTPRSPRKPLRSPSQTPEKRKDRSNKKCGGLDSTSRVSNTSSTCSTTTSSTSTSSTAGAQKPSSWRVAKRESESQTVHDGIPTKPSSTRFGSRFRNLSKGRSSEKPSSGRFAKLARKKEEMGTTKPSSGRFGAIASKFSSDKEDEKKLGSYQRLDESSSEDLEEDIPTSQKSLSNRNFGKSYRFRSSPSRDSLTRKPSSRALVFANTNVDQRDDSNRSIANKPKRPSSWRDDAARSIGRNHSHLSNTGTAVTVDSDPTSNNSGSESHVEETTVTNTNDAKKINNGDDKKNSKHSRRTRPRRNTSHRSAMRRLRRYKDYRKNGVFVGEQQKRFHIDMTGGIQ